MASTDRPAFLPNTAEAGTRSRGVARRPPLCSAISRATEQGLAGTANEGKTRWLAIEKPGPWAEEVALPSAADSPDPDGPKVVDTLMERAAAAEVWPVFIRKPGRSPDTGRYTALIANSSPGQEWMRRIEFGDPAELLDIDLDTIYTPEAPDLGEEVTNPVMLVCAHGSVDICCAKEGNRLSQDLAAERPLNEGEVDSVWQSAHTGAHRLAPVAYVLPQGLGYGRFDKQQAHTIIDTVRRGETALDGLRGRTAYTKPEQVAEIEVLHQLAAGENSVRANLEVTTADGKLVTVSSRDPITGEFDGRRWDVQTHTETLSPQRPLSCGAEPATLARSYIDSLVMTAGPRDQLGPKPFQQR